MERTEWPTDDPRTPQQADDRLDTGRVQFRREERQRRRGPKNYRRSDERISEVLSERLMQSAHLDCSDVTVTVRDATVTLDGTVPERWMRYAIENITITSWGVVEVDNRIRVPRRPR